MLARFLKFHSNFDLLQEYRIKQHRTKEVKKLLAKMSNCIEIFLPFDNFRPMQIISWENPL